MTMPKSRAALLGLLFVLLGLALGSTACAAGTTKHAVFLTLEYPPFASESMTGDGATIEVLREALALRGWEVEVRFLPWARVPMEIAHGEADGALPCWPAEVQRFGLQMSEPLFMSRLGFFVRTSDLARLDVSLDGMKGKRIGSVRGYGYPDSLDRAGVIREDAMDDETNFKKLAARRFDYVVLERAVGDYLLATNKAWHLSADVSWKEPAFAMLPLYVGFVPGRPHAAELEQDFQAGLAKLRREGRLDGLARQYGLDLPPPTH